MCLFFLTALCCFFLFFQTKVSHISGFTFQFLTFHTPKRKHYFSTRINISNRFNHYRQFYEALELGSMLRFIAASKVNELRLESQKRGYRHVINAFWFTHPDATWSQCVLGLFVSKTQICKAIKRLTKVKPRGRINQKWSKRTAECRCYPSSGWERGTLLVLFEVKREPRGFPSCPPNHSQWHRTTGLPCGKEIVSSH